MKRKRLGAEKMEAFLPHLFVICMNSNYLRLNDHKAGSYPLSLVKYHDVRAAKKSKLCLNKACVKKNLTIIKLNFLNYFKLLSKKIFN
jgi:hypothetical protein